ncbi:hypothetical protein H0H93_008516 [Arthromyces matolae]|nr:hypothetical protein H0H93_008516 [Arthromyces matolae]
MSANTPTIDDIPFEVLTVILKGLCPTYASFAHAANPDERIEFDAAFLHSAKVYSDLLTPYAFQEGLLSTTQELHRKIILRFFDTYAPHLRSLIIYGSHRHVRYPYLRVGVAIGNGLGRCSMLQKLHCLGSYPAFLTKAWMRTLAPNLPSTVTSLVIDAYPSNGRELSSALVGLGPSLSRLEIIGWNDCRAHQEARQFELPQKIKNLRHLILRSENGRFSCSYHIPDFDKVKRLFKRIAKQSPLESLHLSLSWNRPADALDILRIRNLGSKLTTLHLWLNKLDREETNDTLTKIASLCCSLVDFAYLSSHFPCEALNHLPPSIQSLELPEQDLGVAISELLKSGRFPKLRRLRLRTPNIDVVVDEHSLVFLVCNDLGIEASVVQDLS